MHGDAKTRIARGVRVLGGKVYELGAGHADTPIPADPPQVQGPETDRRALIAAQRMLTLYRAELAAGSPARSNIDQAMRCLEQS